MKKTDDFTSLSVSSKGRILLHIHENKLLAFYSGNKEDDVYGFKADITSLKGISAKQLVSHEYKYLHFKMDSGWWTPDSFDFCILLANGCNSEDVQFRTETDIDSLRFKSYCTKYEEDKGGIVVSPYQTDYLDLDPDKYERLILVGYDERVATPALTVENFTVIDNFSDLIDTYLMNCGIESEQFIEWAGLGREQWYISNCKLNSAGFKSILDRAIVCCAYNSIALLIMKGCKFNVFTHYQVYDLWFKNSDAFFKAFNNICGLLEDGIYEFSQDDQYSLFMIFVCGIGRFSSLNEEFVPNPSIEVIHELDDRFCTYFDRLSEYVPEFVFNKQNSKILRSAIRTLNLFPRCFKKILEKSCMPEIDKNGNSLFYRLCCPELSYGFSSSWLVYDQLAPYKSYMTKDEEGMFIEGGKTSKELGFDDTKTMAGAILYELICHRRNEEDNLDEEIFSLLGIVGPDYVNFLGVSPLFQAIICCPNDLEYISCFINHESKNINKIDTIGRTPLSYAWDIHSPELMKLLISNGADPYISFPGKNIACEMAAYQFMTQSFSEEAWHLFDLMDDKSLLTTKGKRNKSPFLLALEKRNLGAIRYLGKGGYVRTDEMPQILEALSKIKNTEIREEIYDMLPNGIESL